MRNGSFQRAVTYPRQMGQKDTLSLRAGKILNGMKFEISSTTIDVLIS